MKQTCQNCKIEFKIESDDIDFYKKINVPPPTWCFPCRLIRRMSYRNERTLYKRKCQAPGHTEDMITIFSPDKIDTIYCHSAWWGDSWDPMSYGKDYDFTKSFFVQMRDLWKSVPDIGLFNINPVNSDYCSITEGNKNCYLVIGGDFNEDSSYSSFIFNSRECIDCYLVSKSELNYETIDCISCTHLKYSRYCEGCYDSSFLFNCKNCHDCFGCVNLYNRSYSIFNQQYTKEDYLEKMKEFNFGSYNGIKDMQSKFNEFSLSFPRRYAVITRSVDVTGDFIEESKNCKDCFSIFGGAENSKYLWLIYSQVKNSYDLDHSGKSSFECVDSSTVYPGNRVFYSRFIFNSHNIEYSYNCHNSSNLFGCVGLRNKEYCIFNKQYEKETYDLLREKIVQQMNENPYIDTKNRIYKYGEFFPIEFSPFAYNETVAQELKSLSKEELELLGYPYENEVERNYKIDIEWNNLPDDIVESDRNFVGKIISCEHSGNCKDQCTRAFKITEEEFDFYSKLHIPLPRLCPSCRHYSRVRQKNPLQLWHRKCMSDVCNNEFETSYSPERKEKIYCTDCYNREVL